MYTSLGHSNKIKKVISRELSSVGRTMHYYICIELGFEPQSSHLSTLKVEFLATELLYQNKKSYISFSKLGFNPRFSQFALP
jgi:hypothetical protein